MRFYSAVYWQVFYFPEWDIFLYTTPNRRDQWFSVSSETQTIRINKIVQVSTWQPIPVLI